MPPFAKFTPSKKKKKKKILNFEIKILLLVFLEHLRNLYTKGWLTDYRFGWVGV